MFTSDSNTTLLFNTENSVVITVTDSLVLSGSISVQVPENSSQVMFLLFNASNITGEFSQGKITIPANCALLYSQTNVSLFCGQNRDLIATIFPTLDLPMVIAVSVTMGVLLVISVIIILVVKNNPSLRNKVLPYRNRKHFEVNK